MGLLNAILGPVTGIIDKAVPDADLRQRLKQQIEAKLIDQESALTLAARDVLVAEAKGESWMQRNWRPLTMLSFTAIIVNNYLLAPYVQAFGGVAVVLDIPGGMWNLLTMGLGGYVIGRTLEKTGSSIRIGGGKQK